MTKVGTVVYVWSPDQEEVYGTGIIVKVEPLFVEETGEVITEHFPTIRLHDGREMTGLDCWWHPI